MNEEIFSVEKCSLLLELSHAFSALLTLEELLPSIMAHTKEVLRAESCAILLLDEERQELFFPVTSDMSPTIEERFREIRFPATRGVAGWVLQQGKATHVPDVTRDPRFYATVDRRTGAHTRELLCAPLRTRRGVSMCG